MVAKPAPVQDTALREPDRKLVTMLKNPPIQFEISSARLTPSSREYLDVLSKMLKEQPHIRLLVEGHTDSQDRLGKNQVLSEERALAVKNYLTGKGISPDRLDSAGFGGSRPIAENETAAGRAKNRRIEFRINTP
jgi:outer membrane protein OmpA-like peptidoglycan-associated protein